MAQHDFEIDNQTAPQFRADLNNALEALATLSSGTSDPATTYPNMIHYNSSDNELKVRTEADDAWIVLGTLNQSTNTFEVANLTELTQSQAEDDTDTTYGLVNGVRLGQAVEANVSIPDPETGLYTVTSTVSTSSGSSVSITGLDETKSYLLVLEDVRCSNDSTSEDLRIRFSSNNGSSYSSSVVISENNVRWDTNGAYGEVRILKPAGIFESATTRGGGENNGLYKLPLQTPSGMTSTVDAVRFEWNFGDFAAGNIKVIEVS